MTSMDYFAGHPVDSYEAQRALTLHTLIAKALDAGDDELVEKYRKELETIRNQPDGEQSL